MASFGISERQQILKEEEENIGKAITKCYCPKQLQTSMYKPNTLNPNQAGT